MERTVVSEIVCQKIRLVDSQGDTVAVLGTEGTESPAPTFQMYNAEGLAVLELGVDSQGAGSVVVSNKHAKPAVDVQVDRDNDSGQIVVYNRHSKIAVLVDADCDEDSGRITVCRDGKPAVSVSSDAGGGHVSVDSTKGGGTVDVRAGEDSGSITVWRDGEIMAMVSSNADGGSVSVHSTSGSVSVHSTKGVSAYVYVDTDGDGTVLTLEDGNITSRMPRGGT